MAARITGLWLTAFKSFHDVVVPLEPLTVLIGRNGSGKSNALDALDVLHRLARVGDLREALEGTRGDAPAIRGGAQGCAPFGSDSFALGVRIVRGNGEVAELHVRVAVRPDVAVVEERLSVASSEESEATVLLEGGSSLADHARVRVRDTGPVVMTASRLLTGQLPTRLAAGSRVVEVADEVLGVLGNVFHFDPVPHLMRSYVPERDVVLRRNGENLSAAVAALRADPDAFATLVDVVTRLPEQTVTDVEVRSGGFGEVMLGVTEQDGDVPVTVPARQLSDGMLRMIAVITALLGPTAGGEVASTLLLEELENGLHPTQAAVVLGVVQRAAEARDLQVILTTHSPALLNALPGDDHSGVVVVARDPDSGASRATRLVELPGYHATMATGGLGDVVSAGRLPAPDRRPEYDTSELDRILGIG